VEASFNVGSDNISNGNQLGEEDMSGEDDKQGEDSNYLDIIRSPSYSYLRKRFKVRRLICRVCKLKFRTREETQAHIKRKHRRIQTET
jgi:hypothetical protein